MYDLAALYEANSVEEAVALRLQHPEAQIIAGGTDVLVQMREGKRAGKALISIFGIDALRGVQLEADGTIRIGSLTSFSHITKDPIIQKYINVLGQAVDLVGGPQIRNAGTIGGNTCNGVTSADSASTLFAWDAVVELTGQNGIRRLPIRDFYLRAGVVDLKPDEIQTAILIPKAAYEGYFGHYIKYAMREAMDIATTGCGHGHRHHRLLGERQALRGQENHRRRPHCLRRGRSRPHAGRDRRGRGQGPARLQGDRVRLRQGRAPGRPSPGFLAGLQGLPRAYRRGAGQALPV